jgi:ATP-dependent DNA helicase DinG
VKKAIQNADGNEVLFFGWTDDERVVDNVEVIARGNEESVAVPLARSYLPDVIIHNHPDDNLTPSPQDVI